MASSLAGLMVAFNRLRKINPDEFSTVVKDLETYTSEIIEAVVDAPQDQVLDMQGRAKQAKAFLRAFRECHLAERKP